MDTRRFVVEVYDPATECIASEVGFAVSSLEDLGAVIDLADFKLDAVVRASGIRRLGERHPHRVGKEKKA